LNLEQQYGFEVYPKRDLVIVRGEGALLWDDRGIEFIDCAAGIGVASVGHANPVVADAIAAQSRVLITCPGIFYNDIRGRLLEKLVSISPADLTRGFLCNSGTEAIEAALKFSRITTGKTGFISAMRGFHGRTMGALSATHKYREEFEPLISGHTFVPFNNIERLRNAVDENTAAIILEVVQGEGGVRPADHSYMQSVRRLCDERDVLLILDEVQTGFARTGKMFACEHMGICPDIMTLAKAIAGGIPMGAVLCNNRISSSLGKHGSTFGGNPLACAASLATIQFIEQQGLADQADKKGRLIKQNIDAAELSGVREVRQLGLMVGIELKSKAKPVIESLLEKNILVIPAGPTVIRLLPPLVITYEQIEQVVQKIIETLREFNAAGKG
jgi:acetylornithine/LysW-gamma-L-lysine aminotransferase